MGGHALKTLETRRLGAADYHVLAARVVAAIEASLPGLRPRVVRSVFDKADFGDLDVLIHSAALPSNPRGWLMALFGPREIVHNGNVWSFDVDGFQVDLIGIKAEDDTTAWDYFAWNDAGNLLGRVAHRMGFKLGFDGLSFRLRDGDRLVAEVPVSRDMPAIFSFLGYNRPGPDYRAYQAGFANLDALFVFVASSCHFDATAYALEGRSHVARTRDRKRPTYSAFLRWIEHTGAARGPRAPLSREHHLNRALTVFPAFAAAYWAAMREHRAAQFRKERFNGALVSAWTGVTGKALGVLMQVCRQRYPGGPNAFVAFVDTADADALRTYAIQAAKTCGEASV